MKLFEAKKILKNNGYILEAIDAVTDHNNAIKKPKGNDTYSFYFAKNLARALKEE